MNRREAIAYCDQLVGHPDTDQGILEALNEAEQTEARDPLRLHQCPGCWAYGVVPAPPTEEGWWECDCGERMTCVDLRKKADEQEQG